MPRPPLDRGGGIAQAMTERFPPQRLTVRLSFVQPLSLLRSPRPGCGSQRLLRCRLHPAGRCPNSSSLFPPLAAVVAVAPCRGASGEEERFSPKRPLFQPEEGAFVILLLFYQALRRPECVLRHADPHNPAGSRGSLPAGCWRLPEPAYPRSRRQRSWRRWT